MTSENIKNQKERSSIREDTVENKLWKSLRIKGVKFVH